MTTESAAAKMIRDAEQDDAEMSRRHMDGLPAWTYYLTCAVRYVDHDGREYSLPHACHPMGYSENPLRVDPNAVRRERQQIMAGAHHAKANVEGRWLPLVTGPLAAAATHAEFIEARG